MVDVSLDTFDWLVARAFREWVCTIISTFWFGSLVRFPLWYSYVQNGVTSCLSRAMLLNMACMALRPPAGGQSYKLGH